MKVENQTNGRDDNKSNGHSGSGLTVNSENSSLPTASNASVSSHPRKAKSLWTAIKALVSFKSAVDPIDRGESENSLSSAIHRQDSFLKRVTFQRERVQRRQVLRSDDIENDSDLGPNQTPEENNPTVNYSNQDEDQQPPFVLRPDSNFNFYWHLLVSLTVLYNYWTLIARQAWTELQTDHRRVWYTLDYLCDAVYLLDIVVHMRTGYLEHGILVYDTKKLALHYARTREMKYDIFSLLPLDFFYLVLPTEASMLRFPRFVKVYRAVNFYYMVESRSAHPNVWRVVALEHTLLLLIHWFAALYYLICQSLGFGDGDWGYPVPEGEFASLTRKYLWSLHWSTLTLTTIGDLPAPEKDWEYVFAIVGYLIGIFIFATIVGQVGTVIENRNATRLDFERHLDNAKRYMRTHHVPEIVQTRVKRWYDYTWARGRLQGAGDINSIGLLPDKLKTELAIHVNLDTLEKVTFFKECPPEFLHDLVLKMRAFIFTPGDLVCRKGEVAREMFIIADGVLEVTSEAGEVFATLRAGDFFGEIGILNLEGACNKRTADVRSLGYSELFALSKEDVLSAIKDYPQAQSILEEFGRKRLAVARRLSTVEDLKVTRNISGSQTSDSSKAQPGASNKPDQPQNKKRTLKREGHVKPSDEVQEKFTAKLRPYSGDDDADELNELKIITQRLQDFLLTRKGPDAKERKKRAAKQYQKLKEMESEIAKLSGNIEEKSKIIEDQKGQIANLELKLEQAQKKELENTLEEDRTTKTLEEARTTKTKEECSNNAIV